MKVLDVLTQPWAIVPEKLREIVAVYDRHLRGERVEFDLNSLVAEEKDDDEKGPGYELYDGVAMIAVNGVLAKRMNLFSRISGGTSTQLLREAFYAALESDKVHSIVLVVDSPGGTVDGTQAFADMVYEARAQKKKPIYAIADGQMCSAAYWIASAAEKVFAVEDAAVVGSIGVVYQHIDESAAEERQGIKVTEIAAGKYKRIASTHEPLSDAGRDYLQSQVDDTYAVFVDQVARNRGVSAQTVLKDMADGRVFTARKAVEAGLLDGIMTLESLVSTLCTEAGYQPAGMMASADDDSKVRASSDGSGMRAGEDPPAASGAQADPPNAAPSPEPEPADSGGSGGNGMSDKKTYTEDDLRTRLGVQAGEDLEACFESFAQARRALASGEKPDMIPYTQYAALDSKLQASLTQNHKLSIDLASEKQGREKDALRRKAELVCEKGRAQGRLTPKQINDWALAKAEEDPAHFENVILPTMPRLYGTDDDAADDSRRGSNGAQEPKYTMDAAQLYTQRVKEKIDEAKAKGVTLTRLEAANQIAEEDPTLYRNAMEQSRKQNQI